MIFSSCLVMASSIYLLFIFFSELDEFLQELDEDVEGMQSTVYYLQQELRKSRETISGLERKLLKYKKTKNKGKQIQAATNEEGEQMEEEVKEEDDENRDEDVSESEGPKEDWKENVDNEGEGEVWTEWKEGEEGEDWTQWEEDEEREDEELHDYPEEEHGADWSEDSKEPRAVAGNDTSAGDLRSSPKSGNTNLKRSKTSEEDIDDKFDSPIRKKLKSVGPQSDNLRDLSIAEGVDDSCKPVNEGST